MSIMVLFRCGKSTLLYLLGGLDNLTKGSILVNGRNYGSRGLSLRDREIEKDIISA